MANIAKFLPPIRFRSSLTSMTFQPRSSFYFKFQPLKTWTKGILPLQLRYRIPSFQWKLYAQRFLRIPGHEYSMWNVFGMSVVLGSVSLYPRFAYSMDGSDALIDNHHMPLLDASDSEEDDLTFSTLAKALLVPLILIITIWMNWGHPVIIVSKAFFILFTTKPSPLSVYVFVNQVRREYLRQHPILYKFKALLVFICCWIIVICNRYLSVKTEMLVLKEENRKPLYAKKVEVEDYVLLRVARVEIEGLRLTLVGILGDWWVMQLTPSEGEISALKRRVMSLREKFRTVVEKL